ncbi:sulfurtransferase TusA family protein [Aureimonas populi]|uniref:Sulfurtransferase TusA family protein n=1 Tax=Aureimonas populi TaxID=1701758 RepID=A0ABW5CHH7_9HYPH|nr:sulfurtransferase TusA family protein [Aureimonas populi]
MERLDLCGLKCPLPALKTARRLAALPPGTLLEVLADDPLAALDIGHLCRSEGHELVEQPRGGGAAGRFLIRRGS